MLFELKPAKVYQNEILSVMIKQYSTHKKQQFVCYLLFLLFRMRFMQIWYLKV